MSSTTDEDIAINADGDEGDVSDIEEGMHVDAYGELADDDTLVADLAAAVSGGNRDPGEPDIGNPGEPGEPCESYPAPGMPGNGPGEPKGSGRPGDPGAPGGGPQPQGSSESSLGDLAAHCTCQHVRSNDHPSQATAGSRLGCRL